MWSKAVLLVVAVSLALFLVAAKETEEQQGVEKRSTRPIQTPTSLADMTKVLVAIQKRMNELELSRTITLRGRDGRDGKPGRDGRDGLRGKPGPQGLKGVSGNRGVRGSPGRNGGGVQYVRWGRTTCPTNALLVYKGRIGGEHYTHKGGAANYVCLPETPKYGRYKDGHQTAGYVFGTEYEVNPFNPFTKNHLHDHEAPCAVCYVETRIAKMMIPATYDCPAGWTREYHGYLMTQWYNYAKSEFICVDNDAESVPGTHANLDGALLYPVEGRCGSLPCRPYVDGRELTCAVCTK